MASIIIWSSTARSGSFRTTPSMRNSGRRWDGGTSLDEAATMANEAAKALKGKGVRYDDHVLDKCLAAEIEKSKAVLEK